ncbi:uncharacterized protein LOC119696815 [Motacilla alba alba]|uniref:uncharacterized protein LOC119696815 n=1 Tax=Motacilla alba alba TaxID=1094192 RepID=UPI0018D56EE4|nr:uncharacterized protein LOC119696815 [Motacilla alba alba]
MVPSRGEGLGGESHSSRPILQDRTILPMQTLPLLTTSSTVLPFRLQLVEPLHLKDSQCCLVMVAPSSQGTWSRIRINTGLRVFHLPIMLLCTLILISLFHPSTLWIVPQPKANVWKTLARALGQDHLCLTTASAADPLSTCLVGIPFKPGDVPPSLASPFRSFLPRSVVNSPSSDPKILWRDTLAGLQPADKEPTEFELLGSAHATLCFQFMINPSPLAKSFQLVRQNKIEYQAKAWCNTVIHINAASTFYGQPRTLPKNTFLICGDRAWAGIPSRLTGGPCTFGQLTLFSPNHTQIINWRKKNVTQDSARVKRNTHQIDPECDAEIVHWSRSKNIAVSVFLPWVAAAKALGELEHLECWVAKQANLTSAALMDLLADEEVTRQATLQNRAAIDFLLLLHNHQCEEFEGLCCLNLSSRAEDARKTIMKMADVVHDIKQETSDWLGNIFSQLGISGWVGSILRTVLTIVFIAMCVSVGITIVYKLIMRIINQTTTPLAINRAAHSPELPTPESESSLSGCTWNEAPMSQPWFEDLDPNSEFNI